MTRWAALCFAVVLARARSADEESHAHWCHPQSGCADECGCVAEGCDCGIVRLGDELSVLQVGLAIDPKSDRSAAGKTPPPAVHPAAPPLSAHTAPSAPPEPPVRGPAPAAQVPPPAGHGGGSLPGTRAGGHHANFAVMVLEGFHRKFREAGLSVASLESESAVGLYAIIGMLIVLLIVCLCFEFSDEQHGARGKQDPKGSMEPGGGMPRQSAAAPHPFRTSMARPSLPPAHLGAAAGSSARVFGQDSAANPPLSPAPSARVSAVSGLPPISQLPRTSRAAAGQMEHKRILCNPSNWPKLEATYWIPVDRLSEDRVVIFGPMRSEPVFQGSVRTLSSGARQLAISDPHQEAPLASCESCPSADDPTQSNSLKIRDGQGKPWGELVFVGSDKYYVYRGEEQIMCLKGEEKTCAFSVLFGTDEVACAARSVDDPLLRISVGNRADPVLVLLCILAVGLLNPGDA